MELELQEFLKEVERLMRTTDDLFAFETPGAMSTALHKFRSNRRRHPGDYKDGVWTMVRSEGKSPVEMRVGPESTVVSRRALLEISNVLIEEENDRLQSKFGPTARLYERVCNDTPNKEPK